VLRAEDSHLAEHDSEAIERMGRLTKIKWIQQLDKLKNIHSKEGHSRDKGQIAITEHFTTEKTEDSTTTNNSQASISTVNTQCYQSS
jgi:hypothetical protein